MATAKKTAETEAVHAEVQETVEPVQFTKEQLLYSEKYSNQRDLVDALLDGNKSYTTETVDKMIEDYMKGKVK